MNPFSSLNPSLQRFAGLTTQSNTYETEVGILKSPSVLMSVFNFVKSDKENKEPDSNLIFAEWLESNLDIKLIFWMISNPTTFEHEVTPPPLPPPQPPPRTPPPHRAIPRPTARPPPRPPRRPRHALGAAASREGGASRGASWSV